MNNLKTFIVSALICLNGGDSVIFSMKRQSPHEGESVPKKSKKVEINTSIKDLPKDTVINILEFIINPERPCAQWKYDDSGKIVRYLCENNEKKLSWYEIITPESEKIDFNGQMDEAIVNHSFKFLFICLQEHASLDSIVKELGIKAANDVSKLFEVAAFKHCDVKTLLYFDKNDLSKFNTSEVVDGHDLGYYATLNNNIPVLKIFIELKPLCLFKEKRLLNVALENKNKEVFSFLAPYYSKYLKDDKAILEICDALANAKSAEWFVSIFEIITNNNKLSQDILFCIATIVMDRRVSIELLKHIIDYSPDLVNYVTSNKLICEKMNKIKSCENSKLSLLGWLVNRYKNADSKMQIALQQYTKYFLNRGADQENKSIVYKETDYYGNRETIHAITAIEMATSLKEKDFADFLQYYSDPETIIQ